MNVYLYPSNTETELKNAYIGEYIPWTPDASRTLLYLPLESNVTDYSGNNRSTSPSNISYWTLWWIQTAYNSSWNWYIFANRTPNNYWKWWIREVIIENKK